MIKILKMIIKTTKKNSAAASRGDEGFVCEDLLSSCGLSHREELSSFSWGQNWRVNDRREKYGDYYEETMQ